KQSIYGFRDADPAIVDEAATFIEGLRAEGTPRRAITVSFRSDPAILAFVNDVFAEIAGAAPVARNDAFRYGDDDRFPVERPADGDPVRFMAGGTVQQAAAQVADEIVRLLSSETVRDRTTGMRRRACAADVAILFRSRDSHREFEAALDRRGVPTYVYKGLGFFESDE